MRRSEIGKLGEDIACKFLSKRGYLVLARNYRKPWGEIDIIAQHPNRTLVFVEVKTMREGSLKPEDQMTKAKVGKLRRICEMFANAQPELLREKRGWQIDLVAVTVRGDGTDGVRHYENVA